MIDLKPFCSRDRESIQEPWTQDGKTYATDGRLIIVVPKRADATGIPRFKLAQLWEPVPKQISDDQWLNLPEYPKITMEGCDECFGIGKKKCLHCRGTGKQPESISVPVGNKFVANFYLAMLAKLPGIKIAPSVTGEHEPMPFKFDGGHGLLMPIKK